MWVEEGRGNASCSELLRNLDRIHPLPGEAGWSLFALSVTVFSEKTDRFCPTSPAMQLDRRTQLRANHARRAERLECTVQSMAAVEEGARKERRGDDSQYMTVEHGIPGHRLTYHNDLLPKKSFMQVDGGQLSPGLSCKPARPCSVESGRSPDETCSR